MPFLPKNTVQIDIDDDALTIGPLKDKWPKHNPPHPVSPRPAKAHNPPHPCPPAPLLSSQPPKHTNHPTPTHPTGWALPTDIDDTTNDTQTNLPPLHHPQHLRPRLPSLPIPRNP